MTFALTVLGAVVLASIIPVLAIRKEPVMVGELVIVAIIGGAI